LASASPTVAGSKPKKLLDQTRDVLRLKHYSLRTERSYCDWIERCDDLRRPAVWSSKSARPAKDFESCETVSIAESAQCPLVRCPAQPVNHESRKGIFEIEGKAVRVAASEWSRVAARDIDGKTERSNGREPMSQSGSRTSFNQHEWLVAHLRFAGKAVRRYS